jgi:hypothetical protein
LNHPTHRKKTILAQPFDPVAALPSGTPVPVVDGELGLTQPLQRDFGPSPGTAPSHIDPAAKIGHSWPFATSTEPQAWWAIPPMDRSATAKAL